MIGAEQIPVVTDAAIAIAHPELALLSILAHGDSERAFDIARAAIRAFGQIDEERANTYTTYMLGALSAATRALLEREMELGNFPEPTDLEKRILARGEARGMAKGEAKGMAKGEARGEAKGRTTAMVEALLTVLSSRGLSLSEEQRGQISACRDLARLDAWLRRAAVCDDAAQVLEDD